MPYAAVIQQYQPAGPPAVETDNLDAIDDLLAAHNQAVAEALACDESSTGGDADTGDTSDTTAGPGTTTSGDGGNPPAGTTTGTAPGGSTGDVGAGQLDDDGSCRIAPDAPAGWMAMVFGMLLGARRRRR